MHIVVRKSDGKFLRYFRQSGKPVLTDDRAKATEFYPRLLELAFTQLKEPGAWEAQPVKRT